MARTVKLAITRAFLKHHVAFFSNSPVTTFASFFLLFLNSSMLKMNIEFLNFGLLREKTAQLQTGSSNVLCHGILHKALMSKSKWRQASPLQRLLIKYITLFFELIEVEERSEEGTNDLFGAKCLQCLDTF